MAVHGQVITMRNEARKLWVNFAVQLATPVYSGAKMPELHTGNPVSSELEAIARTTCGLAPWFQADLSMPVCTETELRRRHQLYDSAVECLRALFNSGGPALEQQSVIEAGYLCQAFTRSPKLWKAMDSYGRHSFVHWLQSVNMMPVYDNNWILQKALVTAFLYVQETDITYASQYSSAVRRAIHTFNGFYVGDGIYGDGPLYSSNYYNSIVVHPAIQDLMKAIPGAFALATGDVFVARYLRFLEIQERQFSETGSFPAIGRSIVYRLGAFYALAYGALHGDIVNTGIRPAAVRCALTASLKLMLPHMFSEGFLTPGLVSVDEALADSYISTGSLYATAFFLLPLGLSPLNEFWSDPDTSWTGRRAWHPFAQDHIGIDWALEDQKFRNRKPWPSPVKE